MTKYGMVRQVGEACFYGFSMSLSEGAETHRPQFYNLRHNGLNSDEIW